MSAVKREPIEQAQAKLSTNTDADRRKRSVETDVLRFAKINTAIHRAEE